MLKVSDFEILSMSISLNVNFSVISALLCLYVSMMVEQGSQYSACRPKPFPPTIYNHWSSLKHMDSFKTFRLMVFSQGILKRVIRSFFCPCVNAMGWQPYWQSHMEVSFCTSDLPQSFSVICAYYRYRVIYHMITYMRVWLKSEQERQLTHNEIAWRVWLRKIRRYNNSPPYVMAKWPPQQIPPLNFLVFSSSPGI